MDEQLLVDTAVCAEHQRLLEECEGALEIWNEHRAEFCQFRFIRREAGEELLRLQAKCIRAYTVLQNHGRNCSVCQLVSRVRGPVSEKNADTFFANEMCT